MKAKNKTKPPQNRFKARNTRGSMLVLTMLVMMIIVVVMAEFSNFVAVLVAHQRMQDQAEGLGMQAARSLNAYDRAGRINNLTILSRELVFNSRNTLNEVAANDSEMGALAQRYMDESRQGAQLVSAERERILATTLTDLRALAKDVDTHNQQASAILPWAHAEGLSVLNLEVGYMTGTESNVGAPQGNAELLSFDNQQKYLDNSTNLYYGNVSLKLPAPDDDLSFKLSALPAPVGDTISPARINYAKDPVVTTLQLVKDTKFGLGSCEYLPSTAKVTFVRNFESSLGTKCEQPIRVSVISTATGASPAPN